MMLRQLPRSLARRQAAALGTAAIVLAGSMSTCARPSNSAASPVATQTLYVANGLDGTISRLDARTGRALGDPVPAGPAPWRLMTGPGGRALVVSAGPGRGGALTYVTPVGG